MIYYTVTFYESFQPALLALVLGLVLPEETSLSCLNTTMMVRAAPSISAQSLMGPPCRDAVRKWTMLCLVLAGALTGTPAQVLSVMGIVGSCFILLANTGARAWYNLRWKPFQYNELGASLVAYAGAVLTGVLFPFMAHRDVRTGGRGAMEHVLTTALYVAVAIVVTGLDQVQGLILGMENVRASVETEYRLFVHVLNIFLLSIIHADPPSRRC